MSTKFSEMLDFMSGSPAPTYRSWLFGLDVSALSDADKLLYERAVCNADPGAFGFLPETSLGGTSDRSRFRCSLILSGSRAVRPKLLLDTEEAAAMLPGLVQANVSTMTRMNWPKGNMPVLNGIHDGRVRYHRYDPEEHWQTWRELVTQIDKRGKARGDCEDLSTAVAAELVYNGVPARPYVYKSGERLYHVVVMTNPWGLLDPSRAAGMEGNG